MAAACVEVAPREVMALSVCTVTAGGRCWERRQGRGHGNDARCGCIGVFIASPTYSALSVCEGGTPTNPLLPTTGDGNRTSMTMCGSMDVVICSSNLMPWSRSQHGSVMSVFVSVHKFVRVDQEKAEKPERDRLICLGRFLRWVTRERVSGSSFSGSVE
ncbi:hypothetical protein B296_00039872 [Ensete ventricosum]|uniref:Uncharacterized protein n=1 Tax=Ensete ventricosum TaxID=4639 RepID=A0A426XZL7_ENSVE|nr:hypothetical protein B296_00039872 [Ensete ventricosum]